MANRISVLKSEAVGVIPTASAMAVGEIAVNYADKKIYGKHPGSDAVVQIAASAIHKSTHATGGTDALTPADIGAATAAQGTKADSALQSGAAIANISGLQTALDGKQASGSYATLVEGLVPSSQLPSYVDDVLEFAALANFPETGETGKIYVASSANKVYRWSGSIYVEMVGSPGSTDSVTEGSTNLYFTAARAVSALASTLSSYATQAWVSAQSYATTSSVTSAISALVTGVSSVAGKTGAVTLTKSDVSLGNCDNTADSAKPVSTATQTALNGKVANGGGAATLRVISTADYNALASLDPNTVYIITA